MSSSVLRVLLLWMLSLAALSGAASAACMSECDGAAETLDVAPVPEPEGDVECLAVEVLPEAQLGVRATSSCGRLTGVRRVSCLAPAGRSVVPWRRAGLPTAMRPLRSAGSFRPLRL